MHFDPNGSIAQSSMSQVTNSQKKLTLKLVNGSVTKRVRDIPENFEALKSTLKAQMAKGHQGDQSFIISNQFAITYKDDTGDVINVSDDEDLFAAYDVAETALGKQLKLEVKPRPSQNLMNEPQNDTKSKVQEEAESEAPTKRQKIDSMQNFEERQDDEEVQINSAYVKAAIQEAINPKEGNQKDDDDNMSGGSDSDEEFAATVGKGQGKKKNRGNRDKNKSGLPKKAMKRLIKKELERQCKEIFSNMQGQPDSQSDQISSLEGAVQHDYVKCDGCGQHPIIGVRYKCSVCKNFDFCSTCEERRNHAHPFLKLNKPGQAPKAMLTVIDDSMKESVADLEQDIGENPTFFRNQGPAGNCLGHLMGQFGLGFPPQSHGPPHWNRQMMRGMCGPKHWGGRGGHHGHGHGHGQWRLNRAKVVSVPEEILTGEPGKTFFAKIEFKNNTHWPYKPGVVFKSNLSGKAAELLEEVSIPIDFQVTPMQTFNLEIPMKVKEGAQPTKESGEPHHVASFNFQGPHGRFFGEDFTVKFKVDQAVDEVAFYQLAMATFEKMKHQSPDITFEQVVQFLKEAGGDADLAKDILAQSVFMQKTEAKEENAVIQDSDDDLYS